MGGSELAHTGKRLFERLQIRGILRARGEGEIVVESESVPCACFCRVASIVGIFKGGVGVDGNRQHIAAIVKNILCPVARVIVHIQDGDLPEARQPLRGDGRVVEETISARDLASRVVAGRTAESKAD